MVTLSFCASFLGVHNHLCIHAHFLSVHPELVDGESSKYSAIVTVYLKDGKRYQKRVDKAEGTPDVPITWEELLAKYRGCAQLVLSEDKIKRSIELLEHFEALKDINELTSIIM